METLMQASHRLSDNSLAQPSSIYTVDKIPADVLNVIFSFLKGMDFVMAGFVCHRWKSLTIEACSDASQKDLLKRLTQKIIPFIFGDRAHKNQGTELYLQGELNLVLLHGIARKAVIKSDYEIAFMILDNLPSSRKKKLFETMLTSQKEPSALVALYKRIRKGFPGYRPNSITIFKILVVLGQRRTKKRNKLLIKLSNDHDIRNRLRRYILEHHKNYSYDELETVCNVMHWDLGHFIKSGQCG